MSEFTFDEFQETAEKSAIYPKVYLKESGGKFEAVPLIYTALGLAGEAGEVANKVKKVLRDTNGNISDGLKADLGDELGDVLWYVSMLAKELDIPLSIIGKNNNQKLLDRLDRGVLRGKGDRR